MKASFAIPVVAMIALSAPAFAQDVPVPAPNPSEHRLSPEQVEQVLAEAAARRSVSESGGSAQAVQADDGDLDLVPPIYGEVGFAVGTGGYRSAYGSATYPLGQNGSASILLNFDTWNHEQPWDWGNRPPNR